MSGGYWLPSFAPRRRRGTAVAMDEPDDPLRRLTSVLEVHDWIRDHGWEKEGVPKRLSHARMLLLMRWLVDQGRWGRG